MTDETGRPIGLAVHATVVAIAGRGLLIRGASGSGKSRLALTLIAATTPARPVELVGDDRVLLHDGGIERIVARPHPRIAGFIERRGLGLVAVSWREEAPLVGCVAIGPVPPIGETWCRLRALPTLAVQVPAVEPDDLCRRVLDWWHGVISAAGGATDRTQVA